MNTEDAAIISQPRSLKTILSILQYENGNYCDGRLVYFYEYIQNISIQSCLQNTKISAVGNSVYYLIIIYHIHESQCRFRASRGAIDMIFSVRKIQENCRARQNLLGILFYDLEKRFTMFKNQPCSI